MYDSCTTYKWFLLVVIMWEDDSVDDYEYEELLDKIEKQLFDEKLLFSHIKLLDSKERRVANV